MRKAVSARTTKKHLTKAEKEKRMAVENAFTDDAVIEPPSYLTKTQLEAFNFIIDALRQAKVLSRLDTQTIIQACVAVDMLNTSNKKVARKPSLAIDREFVGTQEKLVRTYLKLCDELCLSPQSRAKLGVLVANQKEEETDPLLNVLQGGGMTG
ncbi:P27 family phage terminase small subunit [Veillonella sp.]